jgi:signal transduction histidine kinase/ligand-binding sensor domain-containing protein/AraC-like DNA-binding protein
METWKHLTRKLLAERNRLWVFIWLFVQATHPYVSAQISFTTIETGNELTQAWITSVEQDFIGFIWIGTSDGLYRYDGYEFETYLSQPGNYNTLTGNNITAIFEDQKQNLWVATTKGLCVYDRNRDIFYHKHNWSGENFTSIAGAGNGDLYIGSFSGLFRFSAKDDSLYQYRKFSATSDTINEFQAVYISKKNEVFVSSPMGLMSFDVTTEQLKHRYSLNNIPANSILNITEDYKGTLWVSTRDHGLLYLNSGNNFVPHTLSDRPDHVLAVGSVLSLLQSKDSVLWIGTENNGLILLDLKKFYEGKITFSQITNSKTEKHLTNHSIYSLFQDRHGSIWIGTYSGLNFYNPINSNFQHYRAGDRNTDLNNEIVNAFFEDGDLIWIATEGGVNILDSRTHTYSYLTHDPRLQNSISSNAVWAITKDKQGNFWFGTWAGGLNKYDPDGKRFTRFYATGEPGALSSNNIFSIVEDDNRNLWIGTMGGGLNKYDPLKGKFTLYQHDPIDSSTISNNWVQQVFIDKSQRMWVSTYNSVDLMHRESSSFHHFFSDEDNLSGISDNGALVIFQDSKDNIWFGTETGLNLFHPADSTFTLFNTDDGLPGNAIMAIREDDKGNLWLSTSNGISKFVDGINQPREIVFKNFDVRDGLQGNRFNRRSSLKTRKGKIMFGGKNGFTSFDPERILSDSIKPRIIITQFLISNKTEAVPGMKDILLENNISLAKKIKIQYRNSVFTIKYAALNFITPEKNQYRYRLEGFEEEWNSVGNQRSATYTNLDPGEYTFRVIASNSNEIWNMEGAAIMIEILPPWYRTSLAYFAYFLLISSIVLLFRRFVVIRTRLQQQLAIQNLEREKLGQVNQMKTRFFTNISHEFRTPLTLIISPLESLLSDINLKPGISAQLTIIQKNARRLLRLINQLLDISEIEADHLKLKVSQGDIVDYIREIASIFRWPANQRNLKYAFKSEIGSLNCYFDGDKLEKIFYNLISNAFKYTPDKGTIGVYLTVVNEPVEQYGKYIEVAVSDSGVGIRHEEQEKIFEHFYRSEDIENLNQGGSGIGLGLVKGLVNVYRGGIRVRNKKEGGTEFIVRLPVDKDLFNPHEMDISGNEHAPVTLDLYDVEQGLVSDQVQKEEVNHTKETDLSKFLLLIVEDNAELRNHLVSYFSETYKVLEAEDGRVALDLAIEISPDLIISDIRMPEMDGIELCKILKTNRNTSHIPIILLTAKATAGDRFEGVSMGADAYITKPFDIKLLQATAMNLITVRLNMKEKFTRSVVIEPSEIAITSIDEKFLQKAIAIVEKNIANPDYSVDTFSKDIGMSRSHLHRKFVGLTGHSPSGFIRTLRMKRASQLLTKGQLTVSEILFEVGIKSRSYFTKSFKEQFGMSPTEYVANYIKEKQMNG